MAPIKKKVHHVLSCTYKTVVLDGYVTQKLFFVVQQDFLVHLARQRTFGKEKVQ